jgi:hypothetical protein
MAFPGSLVVKAPDEGRYGFNSHPGLPVSLTVERNAGEMFGFNTGTNSSVRSWSDSSKEGLGFSPGNWILNAIGYYIN